jgi:hypothetical protein
MPHRAPGGDRAIAFSPSTQFRSVWIVRSSFPAQPFCLKFQIPVQYVASDLAICLLHLVGGMSRIFVLR